MSHIAIDINHQDLTATVDLPLIARSVGEVTFIVTADESWDGYTITIVFFHGAWELAEVPPPAAKFPALRAAGGGKKWHYHE